MATYQELLMNPLWLDANRDKLKALFPEVYTHFNNIGSVYLGFQFKLLGLDWRSQAQLADILGFLEQQRIILREGHTVKRNPN